MREPYQWWAFWNPFRSGAIGGMICGLLTMLIVYLIHHFGW